MDLFHENEDIAFAPLAAVAGDPGDTQATATVLTEGTWDIDSNAIDWFRLDSVSGEINLSIDPTGDTLARDRNLNLELRRDDGVGIGAGLTPSGSEDFSRLLTEDGTYYLRAYDAQFVDNPPAGFGISYRLTIDLPEADADDGNNSQATADPLAAGTSSHSGSFVDWHRIDSPSGELSVTMTPTGTGMVGNLNLADLNLSMDLRDAEGRVIGSGFTQSGPETATTLVREDGPVFVRVYWNAYPNGAPNDVPLNYDLTVTLPEVVADDGNNTREEADLLARGTTAFSGSREDWHRIETGPGPIALTMTPTGTDTDLNLELYNAAGERVAIDFQASGPETARFSALTDGTYYARVYSPEFNMGAPNGVSLDYTLDLDIPRDAWVTDLGLGPVRNASVGVYDIDRDGEDEIVVGASKLLDDDGNEIAPGGLTVLEADGTVKWTKTFDAFPGVDPATGKTYQTTAVTTAPTFSDVNGDGSIDIVVGVGGVNEPGLDTVGQPGDDGGVYALDADGNTLWFHQTNDRFGDEDRPDGVYSAPRVFDVDADGVREVLLTAWDHSYYILDGRTGEVEHRTNLHDTAGATPGIADLNGDGLVEVVVPSDISQNIAGGLPQQGGILHVFNAHGQQNVPGWDTQVGTSIGGDFRGKFDEQSLWASPVIGDLDRDGTLEIIQGTGDFFKDDRGTHVKVWNTDGTLRHQLETNGRVLAAPLLADLDGDGRDEIVAATTNGWVHAFNGAGQELFATEAKPFNAVGTQIINRHPIAVDLDGADGDLEILVTVGGQLIAIDSDGTQLNGIEGPAPIFGAYFGSPVAHDIDGDGLLDLIAAGTDPVTHESVVYRFDNIFDATSDDFRTASYQDNQSLHEIEAFVERFYSTILGREADAQGRNAWTDRLYSGVLSGADVASGFIGSPEFQGRNTTDAEYVEVLYEAFFNRAPDDGGFAAWTTRLADGMSRDDVLAGFTGSQEFANLANSFGINAKTGTGAVTPGAVLTGDPDDTSLLRAGVGAQTLTDGNSLLETTARAEVTVAGEVFRLYGATLGRTPDATGFEGWYNAMAAGTIQPLQAAAAFTNSAEFQQRYGALDNGAFVQLLYQNVLGRDADAQGLANWTARLEDGMERAQVVRGFSDSQEFKNATTAGLDTFMRTANVAWTDVLEGGAGDDVMNGGTGSDLFIFRKGAGGNDVIHGFEPWDMLQLSRFGYADGAEARAKMTQQGADVVFSDQGQTIRFTDTTLADMARVGFNVS
ncbi:MAG: DUF4214 domain-containing protein [Pseudomonadota bacterium]